MTGPFRCTAGQGDLTLSAEAIYRETVGGTDAANNVFSLPSPAARCRSRGPAAGSRPDERRQALINSALNLFNTRTYDEVSVDDIAADAGVSRPLVYHYYGGKAGVFIAALRQAGDDVAESICAAALADPPDWLTRRACRRSWTRSRPTRSASRRCWGEGRCRTGRTARSSTRSATRCCRSSCCASNPPSDSAVLHSVLRGWIGMVETMGREWLRRGEPTREELERLLPELLRAVLGAAAWHDTAVAAVLPSLSR